MNLCLFLLANTGQPFSMQTLTKSLAIPSVSQTSRYLEALQDAYLILPLPKFSTSFKKRVVAPAKYYAIDNGLRRANAPQSAPDTGRRLENLVYLALRSRDGGAENFCYAGEKDAWNATSSCRTQPSKCAPCSLRRTWAASCVVLMRPPVCQPKASPRAASSF